MTTIREPYVVAGPGADWDEVLAQVREVGDDRSVVNLGPQHPSTHGVLRLILELEGETVVQATCGIGYLHTGIEKNCEYRTWTQGVTFVTRADYLAPIFNEAAYCLGVERLLGVTDQVTEPATVIRMLMMELNRVASHLVHDTARLARLLAHQCAQPLLVVAAGGGNIISAAVDLIAGVDYALGILPLGSSNDVGRALALQLDPLTAAMALRSGTLCAIDAGQAIVPGRPARVVRVLSSGASGRAAAPRGRSVSGGIARR